MATHIVLLRGVNVGGNRKLAMSDLRTWAEGLGFAGVRTLLQSGNLLLDHAGEGGAALEQRLESAVAAALGLSTDFIVRTPEEMEAVIAHNPFPEAAEADPSRLLVTFLKQPPAAEAVAAVLAEAARQPEQVRADGREVYVVYPSGAGDSKLKLNFRVPGTARNWNTVRKLAAMARA